jgi:diguanylate cyclase (GGDEF)-like protein
MSIKQTDARLRELQFLARLDREDVVHLTVAVEDPDRLMILHLLRERYINHLAALSHTSGEVADLEEAFEDRLRHDLDLLLRVEPVAFRINHRGRLRISELQQALQTGRDREPFGIMFSKRHLDRDLMIAIISARIDAPVAVAYFDLNDLKVINDKHGGHDAGDAAIRTYLQTIATICGDNIEGYRGDGGDEVVLIMKSTSAEQGRALLDGLLRKLHGEKVEGVPFALTASCGVVVANEPAADAQVLKKRADEAQYRAKAEAKKLSPRLSAIVVEDRAPELVVVKAPS